MRWILVWGATAICQLLINRTVAYRIRQHELSRRDTALILASLISCPVLLLLCATFLFGGFFPFPLSLVYILLGSPPSFS